jgi:hypothetical protein
MFSTIVAPFTISVLILTVIFVLTISVLILTVIIGMTTSPRQTDNTPQQIDSVPQKAIDCITVIPDHVFADLADLKTLCISNIAPQPIDSVPQEIDITPPRVRFGVGNADIIKELRQELRRRINTSFFIYLWSNAPHERSDICNLLTTLHKQPIDDDQLYSIYRSFRSYSLQLIQPSKS